MMLYGQGKGLLEDPVSKYLPSLAGPRVFESGNHQRYETREAAREITVHDVLTHMSGLTYGFQNQHAVDAIYRTHGLGDFSPSRRTLAEEMELLGSLPLQFDPGTSWCYSLSPDAGVPTLQAVRGVAHHGVLVGVLFGHPQE